MLKSASSRSKSPIRVLHVISGLGRGGAETVLTRLIAESDPARVRHAVLTIGNGGVMVPLIEEAGGKVFIGGMGRGPRSLLSFLRMMRSAETFDADLIQGWMVHGNVAAWLLKLTARRRQRLVWGLRATTNLIHERLPTRILTRVAAALSRSVDLLLSNSHSALQGHLELGYAPKSTLVVPNGFDLDLFRPQPELRASVRRVLGAQQDAFLFGVIGRYHPAKGQQVFLEALPAVLAANPNSRFVLVGDFLVGNPDVAELISRYGLAAAVTLVPAREDVSSLLQAFDVLCLPSIYESFPNVLGEAMACGLPTIATNVSDVKQLLGDAGLVVPPGEPNALSSAMIDIMRRSTEERADLGRKARVRMERSYALISMVRRYEAAYASLIDGQSGSPPAASIRRMSADGNSR